MTKMMTLRWLTLFTSVMLIAPFRFAFAQEDVRYQANTDESPIYSIHLNDQQFQLTINSKSDESQALMITLATFTDNTLTAQLKSDMKLDELAEKQEKLGISYATISSKLELEGVTSFEAIRQIQENSSGIFTTIDNMGNVVITLSNPTYIEKDGELQVNLFGENVLTFTKDEAGTLTYNDYSLTSVN